MYARSALLFAMCVFALTIPGRAQDKDKKDKITCAIIYVPTDQAVVEKMLTMAKITKNDVVFDLGCGDGRIVCTAAKKYGAKGVGVDIDPARIKDCLETMKKFGVTKDQVEIRQGDALKVKDLQRATVICFYMLPEFMAKLEPQVKKLKAGTRLVAHDYAFPNLKPDQTVKFEGPERTHMLYLWTLKDDNK
jgi:precorrin-6B methylase 2